jgi:hypothetical protein
MSVCTAGYWYNYGVASPKPKAWTDNPEGVGFVSVLMVYDEKYSKCIYTNAAAPSAGDGDMFSCDGLSLSCSIHTESVLGRNADALITYDTKVKPLIACPVTSTPTTQYSAVTSRKTETVVPTTVHTNY